MGHLTIERRRQLADIAKTNQHATDEELRAVIQSAIEMSEIFDMVDGELATAQRATVARKGREALARARSGLTRLQGILLPEYEGCATLATEELTRRGENVDG